MKRVNLAVAKCTNLKCKFRIITETIKKECPVCHSNLIKENDFRAQGLCDGDDIFIVFKKKNKGIRK